MRKLLLNRKFVWAMTFWALLITLPPTGASAMPSGSLTAFNTGPARDAQIHQIMTVLSKPEVQAHLLMMGINRNELQSRLSSLDDQELAAVSKQADTIKAGGDALGLVVVILVIVLLVILIMKLSDKKIEVKDSR